MKACYASNLLILDSKLNLKHQNALIFILLLFSPRLSLAFKKMDIVLEYDICI